MTREEHETFRPEYLPQLRKSTGKVYQLLAEVMEKYFYEKSLIHWDELKSELKIKRNTAEHTFPYFPEDFFDEMADPLLRWHWDRYNGIRDAEITPTFQMLWQYHRKYLGQVQTDEMWTEAIKDGDEILKDADPHLKGFVMAILRDLEKRNPREEDNSANEQAAEKSASETV